MLPTREKSPHPCTHGTIDPGDDEKFNYSVLRAIYEASPNGVLVVDDAGKVVSLNRKFLEVWKLEEFSKVADDQMANMFANDVILKAIFDQIKDPEAILNRVYELYADREADDLCELSLKDGRTLERYSTVIRGNDQRYLGRVWFFRDITQRRRLEVKLRSSEQQFRAAAKAALNGMIALDASGVVQYWNPAAQRILGYSPLQILGRRLHDAIAPERYRAAASDGLKHFAHTGKGFAVSKTLEFYACRRDGVEIPIELSIAPMEVNGEWWAIGIVRDISARKIAEERLAWLAHNDALTGLPNRAAFEEQVREAIAQSARGAGALAMMYLDIDHFKHINDTLGHTTGDRLLQEAANRLRVSLRSIDKVARLGGDEFAVLATQIDSRGAAALAAKILGKLSSPLNLSGDPLHITGSIGIALHDGQHETPDALMGRADLALYLAKAEGRNTFRFFRDTMRWRHPDSSSLIAAL